MNGKGNRIGSLRALALCAAALLGALLTGSCGSSEVEGEPGPRADYQTNPGSGARAARGGPARIVGTTVDASSGEPLAGCLVQGPGGTQATSDRSGRFEIRDLPVGAAGELVATAEDGRSGRNRLRPLKSGSLEVVVFVR